MGALEGFLLDVFQTVAVEVHQAIEGLFTVRAVQDVGGHGEERIGEER